MEDRFLDNYLRENQRVYDRFTFDKIFRFLLSNDCEKEEAKDIILHNCALSALVLQERIHNEYYYKICVHQEFSKDLVQFMNEIAEKIITLKGKERERFYDYLRGKMLNVPHNLHNCQNFVTWDKFLDNTDVSYNSKAYEKDVGKIQTTYEQLEQALDVKLKPAPHEWDRLYNVDFFIEINGKYIGLQIKPTTFKHTFEDHKWKEMQETSHHKFQKKFAGRVFTVFSVKEGKRKVIHNPEVVEEIKKEIERSEKGRILVKNNRIIGLRR